MKIQNQKSMDEKFRAVSSVVPGEMVAEIKRFLLTANDAQLYNINPYWNIHCPACRGVTQHSHSLSILKHADKCPACATVFDAGFDTSIEVSFGVNTSIIKPADVDDFSKIVAGFDMEPGIEIDLGRNESHSLTEELREGNYFLFIAGERKALNLVVLSGKSAETQKISFEYRDNLPLLTTAVAKEGTAEIVLVNRERAKKALTFARLGPRRWPSA